MHGVTIPGMMDPSNAVAQFHSLIFIVSLNEIHSGVVGRCGLSGTDLDFQNLEGMT